MLAGAVLDAKYQLLDQIGQGGMGAVYRARHVGTQRLVAIKVLLPALVASPEAVMRFRREAQAAGQLRHANIVDVTDCGIARVEDDDVAYIAMEYLEGLTLREMIDQRGALPPDVVLDIVEQVAAALVAAHAAGLVHRDLKPDNILLVRDGRGGYLVRVLDFGIAHRAPEGGPAIVAASDPGATTTPPPAIDRLPQADTTLLLRGGHSAPPDTPARITPSTDSLDSGERLTLAGMLIGTPHYMSPEQCRGDDVAAASDIYSLGVLTWEALAGYRPFQGQTADLIEKHLHAPPPALPNASPALSAVVLRALAKSPQERFASATAYAGCLRVAAEGPGTIFRQAIVLFASRFPEMLELSWRCARASVFASFALMTVAAITAMNVPMDRDWRFNVIAATFLPAMSLWMLAGLRGNAIFLLAVDRLRTRPLERLDPAALFQELRERLGLRDGAGYFATTWRLCRYFYRNQMRLAAEAGVGDLAIPVVLLERLPESAIASRCVELSSASRKPRQLFEFGMTLALVMLLFLEYCLLLLAFGSLGALGAGLAGVLAVGLAPVNAVLLNPILSLGMAMMYFRARQANGEDVPMAAVMPSRL
jgi:serine/threonine protein kinase